MFFSRREDYKKRGYDNDGIDEGGKMFDKRKGISPHRACGIGGGTGF